MYGQDPGSFTNQAQTAGLKATLFGFEFTPDGVNASKGTYDSDGWTFAYDYFDANNPISPLAKFFVDEFKKEYGEDPDFYAANFYENTFVMWEVIRRVLARAATSTTATQLDKALQDEPHRRRASTAATTATVGTYTLDPDDALGDQAPDGRVRVQGRKVTPLAFFGIGGEDYKTA